MDTKTVLFFILICSQIVHAEDYLAKDYFKNHACTDALSSCAPPRTTCPSTSKCLNVTWFKFPPYTDVKKDNLSGVIPGILSELLGHCCSGCWSVKGITVPQKNYRELHEDLDKTDFVFPIFLRSDAKKEHNMSFVPIINTLSVNYITKRQSTDGIPMKLISAIWNAWPVLVVALLFSFVAGIFLWFLEFRSNPTEFPTSFVKGSWEGFWWAFVSMTTVGYGDRSPRSFLGRGFAIFWILIGICICSIFTATLTTALTTISLEETKTLSRAKVGAIKNSLEVRTGVANQAKITQFDNETELWAALEKNKVDGILLDSYFSATPKQNKYIEDNDLKISETVKSEGWSYGLLVKESNLAECMKEQLEDALAYSIFERISREIESAEETENEAEKRSDSIFNPSGDLFYPALFTCIGFTVVMIAAGFIWEFFLLQRYLKKIQPDAQIPRNNNDLDQMEREMVDDVHRLFASWKAKMAEVGRALEVVELDEKA